MVLCPVSRSKSPATLPAGSPATLLAVSPTVWPAAPPAESAPISPGTYM